MKILVTGASGYIGHRLIILAKSMGFQVFAASRCPVRGADKWIPFDMAKPLNEDFNQPVDAIVHLAACTGDTGSKNYDERNVLNALIEKSNRTGAKLIFASSQTASADAPTEYGRIKWQLERDVLEARGIVVRIGQVYGGPEQGLFGILVNAVRKLGMLPGFVPEPMINPVHVDDCARGLLNLVLHGEKSGRLYKLASDQAVSFTDFLKLVARYRLRKRRLFFPVPVFLVNFSALILGRRLSEKFGLYRLTSLFDLPSMDSVQDLAVVGIRLRPLISGMHKSGDISRRMLLEEGEAIFSYVLKKKPSNALMRRYVRMVEKLRGGTPLYLSRYIVSHPVILALFDAPGMCALPAGEELLWRINAAVLMAEASPQGARRFLLIGEKSNWFLSLLAVILSVSSEIFWRTARFVLVSRFICLKITEFEDGLRI